ncbi:endolytic transglycosylase MltG [Roseisolibacter sp. H3M3-2]|uniref:endolytic transglycosylase MltG n=1 Tax=Roseisolibacter sp. H3M3-2 TaxID=3031323 RepID=UPI0023DB00D2|nr:endolytic transglycosylase MltG [Roseisolibacter sp. H3M3-2]MDF1504839.1 endolytic transglycosylase MltG [Roseisolibacter sp. H3M3-2]
MRSPLARLAPLALAAAPACGGPSGGPPARVVIPRGATFAAAADSLAAKGVVGSATGLRLWAKLKGRDRAIKPGTYEFQPGQSFASLVDALESGKGVVRSMTVVEGWELRQIAPQLARVLEVPLDSVQAAVRDTALLRRLDVPTETLEGYLFPATYTFGAGTSAREAVAQMVAAFERQWAPEWDAELQKLAMKRHDVVTLASIVEREARRPEERPVIAAVYHNRIRKGMRLEADPTVEYALRRRGMRMFYRDLEVESPYNTYRVKGLPPGPIGAPGGPSLAAAVRPATVPYLFFVAHPDGHHEFRTTFARYQVEVREARAGGDAAARADAPRAPPAPAPAPTGAPTGAPRRRGASGS